MSLPRLDAVPSTAHGSREWSDAGAVRDACVWAVLSALVLGLAPIGVVSGDGLAQSLSYTLGTWRWNPNHLLLEPVGAWWQGMLTHLDVPLAPPDVLTRLSVVCGSLALGLFRGAVAPALTSSRWAANHATAWLALSAGFATHWVSNEAHMIQMPFLVLSAAAVAHYAARPSWRLGLGVGAAVGLAALAFVSDALLAPALALTIGVWHVRRREGRAAVGAAVAIGLGAVLVAGVGFLLAWAGAAPPGVGLLHWVRAYAGGGGAQRVAVEYGLSSLSGLPVAVGRAGYGAASALVDLAPVVEALRDHDAARLWSVGSALRVVAFTAAVGVVVASAAGFVRRPGDPSATAVRFIVVGWTLAVLPFDVYWNNSDLQFYFQLAVPLAALIASLAPDRLRRVGLVSILSGGALVWDAGDLTFRQVLYPWQVRVAQLGAAIGDAGLVVYPGEDEIEQILFFVKAPPRAARLSITSLAEHQPARVGLEALRTRVEHTLAAGGRVATIGIFDVPPRSNPWKFLGTLGYDLGEVRAVLERFPLDSVATHAGPFPVRVVHPAAASGVAPPLHQGVRARGDRPSRRLGQ